MRSMLFVPGDSEKKLAKAQGVAADGLILDLEDSVAGPNKAPARALVRAFLDDHPAPRRCQLWVRINPLHIGVAQEDLEAVIGGRPDGIVQPKTEAPADVVELACRLDELEAQCGIEHHATEILPIVTETPGALFSLGGYAGSVPRLRGLTWGAEDLSAAIGATVTRDADGRWRQPYELARSLTLMAAHAAGVEAIDTLHANFRDAAGLKASAEEARRDGFTGKLAIHPAQVDVINAAFSPNDEEVAWAQRVVGAFADNPGAATVGLDGEMVDIPHLKRARRILQVASALSGSKN